MPLKKLTIVAYRDDTFNDAVETFTVMINPDEYSYDHAIEHTRVTGQGAAGEVRQFSYVRAARVSFTLWFDGTGVVPTAPVGTTTSIDGQITAFKKAVITYDGELHRPRFVKLSWGKLLFKGMLEKLNITYTMFTPDGEPIRAKCGVTFVEYISRRTLELMAKKSSPDLAHLVTVRAGDTLPLLCHRVYGSSVHYPKVARFNGLGSFRALTPGMQLLFPRLRQSER